jgi:hypothetical protein
MGLKLNATAFNKSIQTYANEFPDMTKKALEQLAPRIIVDVVELPNKSPLLDGFLTAGFYWLTTNRKVEFNGKKPIGGEPRPNASKKQMKSKNTKNTKKTKKTKKAEKVLNANEIDVPNISGMEKIELRIGNVMKYSARLHENPFNPGEWSEKKGGVGYKFLSSKLESQATKYRDLFAEFFQKVSRKLYL